MPCTFTRTGWAIEKAEEPGPFRPSEKTTVIKQILYTFLAPHHRSRALVRLRKLEEKLVSPEARFAVPFVFCGSGHFKSIEPRQNPLEIEDLYRMVCQKRPTAVLEIGTARGGTLYLWAQAAGPDATIVSVDLPGGGFGGAYPPCRIPFYRSFAGPKQGLHLLREDSHSPETIQTVQQIFQDQPIDFLFIDGDHTYEGVRTDFAAYGPMVRPGGVIAFHDILPRQDIPAIEVHRFWREVKQTHAAQEIVGPDGSGKKVGIGVIHVERPGIRCPEAGEQSVPSRGHIRKP
jgi:predicted O-methyltransferase YrrM